MPAWIWKRPDDLGERRQELERIIADITFEDKHKYSFTFFHYPLRLAVKRHVICSVKGEMIDLHNVTDMPRNISNDDFVKLVFMLVGQFQAHEFVESFRYKGMQAFMPHDVKIKTLYGRGDRINWLVMRPWTDLIKGRSLFTVGILYLWRGFKLLLPPIFR